MNGRWWSQRFAPEGSAAAEGITKQLGRPSLDPLTILVREAAQNSWDARRPGVVDFRVRIRTLGEYAQIWQETLLPGPSEASEMSLSASLRPDSTVLIISDRNTVGLGGPLRAGRRARENEHADFVQFLRNVGEPSDHQFGGGTYGFGKGIFYRLSKAGSILVSTRTEAGEGEDRRRLMGAALGHSYYQDDRRFTGRHWWGTVGEDDVPDPLLGDHAAETAGRLGLPAFDQDETGTDIVVIGADLGSVSAEQNSRPRDPAEAATFLMSSILWHLWPKFIPDSNGDCMRFSVGSGEVPVPVPSPTELAEFEPFVEALEEVRAGRGHQYTRKTPPKHAGTFNLQRCVNTADDPSRLMVSAARPFAGPLRHVARMRTPELVVDYLEGPQHPDTRFAYAGVFKASADADAAFAESEPPTHDAWISTGLSGAARGVVMYLNGKLQKMIEEDLGTAPGTGDSDVSGLGGFSMRLASLIPNNDLPAESSEDATSGGGSSGSGDPTGNIGSAASGQAPGGRGGGVPPTRKSSVPRIVGRPSLQIHDGLPYLVAKVFVPESTRARTLSAEASVVIEGGAMETGAPLGAAVPQINQWQRLSGGPAIVGSQVFLPAGADSEWLIYSTHVPDAVVRFRVQETHDHVG